LNWGVVATVGTPTTVLVSSTGVSWLTSLLPNIDEGPLYNTIAVGQALNYVNPGQQQNNLAALSTVVPTFLCPADKQRTAMAMPFFGGGSLAAPTNYKACAGANWVGDSSVSLPAISGTVGRNAGSFDGVDHGNGIICRGGGTSAGGAPTVTANQDLIDGPSKTFLAGEAVPEWCAWSIWFWFDGSTATCGIPLNFTVPGTLPSSFSTKWQDSYSFTSRHRGGSNFAFCDCSVSFVKSTIDTYTYQALATINGQETVTWPAGY
jgi:prepilin-type processing-associated H-X9-DG protein